MNEDKKKIVTKVSELYQKYGIKSITMDDVARELGISKKTLYKHVSNKEDLVKLFVEFVKEQRNYEMESIKNMNNNAIEKLLEVNKIVIKMLKNFNPSIEYDLKKHYPEQFAEIRNIRKERMYKAVRANLEKGINDGLYRKEMNTNIIAKAHVSRVENSFTNEVFTLEEITSPNFSNELMIYHLRAIVNKKGLEFLESKIGENGLSI
ncbi:MAG: TetR/AcrR family transcriptional regulator [Bacteroidota bacterium]|nr:TetR/AcrR family transcriptional regulator [Bacteroidota bacterium]